MRLFGGTPLSYSFFPFLEQATNTKQIRILESVEIPRPVRLKTIETTQLFSSKPIGGRKWTFGDVEGIDATSPLAYSRSGLDPSTNRFHAPIVYHERYSFPGWPSTHTFAMDKFERLAHAVTTKTADSHLPRPLVRSYRDFFRPLDVADIPRSWLMESSGGPLADAFVEKFTSGDLSKEECRWIGFREHTSRKELIERTLLEVAGTVLASQLAVRWGIASNLAGGTHHASRDRGAGYTILNDLAVAASALTAGESKDRRVLVVDADVHQGDGTAKFERLHESKRLSTLSVHCSDNYPNPKATSSYDIGLPSGIGDDEYMNALETAVNHALQEVQPDLVLYDAGVDVFVGDKLGKFRLTEEGIRRRDRWLLERCVCAGIPVAAVIGGGYDVDVNCLARRHAIVHEECAYLWRKYQMWKHC